MTLAMHTCTIGGVTRVPSANVSNQTIESEVVDPPDTTVTTGYKLLAAASFAKAQKKNAAGTAYVNITGDWETGGFDSGDYDCQATLNSGTLDGGSDATGSWLSLSTTRTWEVTRTNVGANSANLTIEIRDATTLAVLDSGTINLTATVSI